MKIYFILLILLFYSCSREWNNPLDLEKDDSSLIPVNGLIAYYPFNGNANDESGNENKGTVKGATLAKDRFGAFNSAYSFDGVDDYIEIGDKFNNLTLPLSISAWFYKTTVSYSEFIFHSDDFSTDYYYGFWFITSDAKVVIHYGDGGYASGSSRRGKQSNSSFPFNKWNHVAAVINSSSDITIYINGVDAGGTYLGSGGNMKHSNLPARIGKGSYHGNWLFKGIIDDLLIYNRTLKYDEIQALYHEGGWSK